MMNFCVVLSDKGEINLSRCSPFLWQSNCVIVEFKESTNIGGSKGAPGTRAPGPNSFIFMQYLAKNRLAHPLWELAAPHQENPGYATD